MYLLECVIEMGLIVGPLVRITYLCSYLAKVRKALEMCLLFDSEILL